MLLPFNSSVVYKILRYLLENIQATFLLQEIFYIHYGPENNLYFFPLSSINLLDPTEINLFSTEEQTELPLMHI